MQEWSLTIKRLRVEIETAMAAASTAVAAVSKIEASWKTLHARKDPAAAVEKELLLAARAEKKAAMARLSALKKELDAVPIKDIWSLFCGACVPKVCSTL